ncbi:hypothetical protein C8J56DRAFT_714943, partial [Mycena floridula]
KVKTPTVYDGITFDKFCFEFDTWRELLDIPDEVALKMMSNFLSKKVFDFYMGHVAMKQHKWNVAKATNGLFNYCFPGDIKEHLRSKLMHLRLGKR